MKNLDNKDIKSYMTTVLLIQSLVLLSLLLLQATLKDSKEEISELRKHIIIDDAINEYYYNAGCTDMLQTLNISFNLTTKELYEECKIK